jgi:Uma2 family endonuclease
MGGERARRLMSAGEFLAWDDGTDTRYELIDGVPVAMAPASRNHARIAQNIGALADRALADRHPCRSVQQGGVRLPDSVGGNVFVPDVLVTCEPVEDGPVFEAPRLVVEILSPSTRRYDERVKLPGYGGLPTIEEIWLVEAGARCVHVWRRTGAASWSGAFPFIGRASFASPVLGVRVVLDDVYALTGLDAPGPGDDAGGVS